jgi:hypothetical protein
VTKTAGNLRCGVWCARTIDTTLGKVMLRFVELVRVVEHGLGRDTADVETRAAK